MVAWLVLVGEREPEGRSNILGSILLDLPLPFKNSNSCNPTSVHDTKKVYLKIGVVEVSLVFRARWAQAAYWAYTLGQGQN